MLYFEDFIVGETRDFGAHRLSEAELLAFARRFDAQDFHIDAEKARHSFAGGLIASGWHSCAILWRLLCEGFLLDAACLSSPGIEQVKWLRPVRAGDALTARRQVVEATASDKTSDHGSVRFRCELINQAGETVLELTQQILFRRRSRQTEAVRPPPPGSFLYVPPAVPSPLRLPPQEPDSSCYFDEVAIGDVTELGAVEFTREEIRAFTSAFDPQSGQLEAAAEARRDPGAVTASGWHTACGWMALMVAHRRRLEAAAKGAPAPRIGVSPGFQDLRWLKPVLAGDRISYSSTVTGMKASASRPGWGLVFHHNAGVNQQGQKVFSFEGCVFWERRPG